MPAIAPVGFEEFFEKEYRPLVGFARRLGAGAADAEDAVQAAFAHLLIAWPKIDNQTAWIRTVVTREVRHAQRGRRTKPLDGWEKRADTGRAEPDERDRVLHLLRRLPPDEMTVLAWEIDGYSIVETAEFTGMSVSDVRNARRRARTRLARLMKEH
ncbi:MAG: sigma-70 family RNA polymerase sigma factor [Actinoplanes sp.]